VANNRAIAPLGEAKPNTEVFRLLAARMGYTESCFGETDEDIARNAFRTDHERAHGLDWEELKAKGWQRLNVPSPFAPFAQGGFPTPSGKCEFYSAMMARQGLDPLPTFTPPRESAASNPELARRYPLALLSPPARNALNSTFANLPLFLDAEKTPRLDMHPDDARARGIASGDRVRAFNDRGALVLTARVSDRPRPGVVVALSIWWRKLSPDGNNANALTGQALTDMGRAATFYDTLVEVERVSPVSAAARSGALQSSSS
jgi:anaerobic selenocysteine-containing dehydrogenase